MFTKAARHRRNTAASSQWSKIAPLITFRNRLRSAEPHGKSVDMHWKSDVISWKENISCQALIQYHQWSFSVHSLKQGVICRQILVNLRNRGRGERRRQTLCDKRDNTFEGHVWIITEFLKEISAIRVTKLLMNPHIVSKISSLKHHVYERPRTLNDIWKSHVLSWLNNKKRVKMRKQLDTSIFLYWLLNPQSWRGKFVKTKVF